MNYAYRGLDGVRSRRRITTFEIWIILHNTKAESNKCFVIHSFRNTESISYLKTCLSRLCVIPAAHRQLNIDGFLLKYLEALFIQSTFRSLEMHSKWRYKICICSVILGELESFRKYKDFNIIFSKISDAFSRITKVRI